MENNSYRDGYAADKKVLRDMIDEAKRLTEESKKRAAGTKFYTDLLGYITHESEKTTAGSGRTKEHGNRG